MACKGPSKLLSTLKALINAPHASPGVTTPSTRFAGALKELVYEAREKGVGWRAWMTISAATSTTLNCPQPWSIVDNQHNALDPTVSSAELVREIGLKCISFSGVARTINCLTAFHADLPEDVAQELARRRPTRGMVGNNFERFQKYMSGGWKLWNSIYKEHQARLYQKLGDVHPDLAPYILFGHYGGLLAEISDEGMNVPGVRLGRGLTSVAAVAALRAQTGVGRQVTSHIFGLINAYALGAVYEDGEPEVVGESCWLRMRLLAGYLRLWISFAPAL
ncbi:uncharacterized protein A1O9_05162 [Exophiala aquamarina CBS 119918]|uniref:Uncharacterized protein n=1 Tax=Exophiala aquamarina CBS 119918 TaxID=1182545 RepID=A0A072PP23_9EURO|nr:uncharacterized protein A1O9_05162 [Exophiala aquamarina CBS 119918]KEF57245.1 hypothetical protein A1O9_05162 [Exophiala aquamarina CBS 119918]